MVGSYEKAQKADNSMRKGHCIIQLGYNGCCNPPTDLRQNSGVVGSREAMPSEVPRSLHFM